MKVKEIYIKDFRQFKDLTLNLTYPKGHPKEGMPLDKVCIIGQSGTGKTNLLKLLYLLYMPGDWTEKLNAISISELENKIGFKVVNTKNKESLVSFKNYLTDDYSRPENLMALFTPKKKTYEEIMKEDFISTSDNGKSMDFFFDDILKANGKLIYLPTGLKYDLKETNERYNINQRIFDFSKESIYGLWNLITEDVKKYQEEELRIRQKISILAEQGNLDAAQKEVAALKEWRDNNASPIKVIAENCINPLIKNFSLKVKEELSIEQKEDIGFIKLESLDGKEMPYSSWSTGTKQVILSALPLYLLKPENSTILFDEPETSLYPDLQRIIIDYYQNFTKNSQFFYATHSPIIASCFEPWEIVELKFNEEGYIYRDLYFKGENHVDNYYIDPRYLNYDLMLKKVFDMKFTNGDKRYEALSEHGMLENQLQSLKKADSLQTEEAKNILDRFKILSRKLEGIPE